MAYSLVVDTSNFKPYDFGQTFQVLKDITADNRRNEELLDKIYMEAGKYSLPEGSKYGEQQKRFYEDLDRASENFYSSRGSNEAKKAIRDMWRRYNKDITPISKMVEDYNKGQETLAKLGPDAIVANKDQLSNIENYYGGMQPSLDYRSKSNLQQIAAKTVQSLDNALMQSPELASTISNQYLSLKQSGLDSQQALNTILNYNPNLTDEGAAGVTQLTQALDNLYQQYAFEEGTPENEEIRKSLVSGAIMGIQAPKYVMQADHSYENAATKANREYQQKQAEHFEIMKQLEEEEKNLKVGRILRVDAEGNPVLINGKRVYDLNIDEAAKRLKALQKSSDKPASVPQHVIYGGRRYAVKVTRRDFDTDYDIYDIDTNEYVTDPTVKQGIIDKYEGRSVEQNQEKKPKHNEESSDLSQEEVDAMKG